MMFKKSNLFFIVAETPLHPGSGGESLGLVDLPIQRERHTNFPKIESSSLKGCIREALSNLNKEIKLNGKNINLKEKITYREDKTEKEKETDYLSLLFGPEPENTENLFGGALSFTDARILFFPVKSLKGVFAWITCPMVLERFKEDFMFTGIKPDSTLNDILNMDFSNLINTLPKQTNICIASNVVFEEYTFEVKENEQTEKIAKFFAEKIFPSQSNDIYKFWKGKLAKDLVILPDDVFEQFVTNSTEIITRIRIDPITGTVKSGSLWTEEYLPQDTIMYSIVMASPIRLEIVNDKEKNIFKVDDPEKESEKVLKLFEEAVPEIIQIGGNQTIGKGLARVQIFR